ncbi:hypothetical protein QYF61_008973 [Mycteria americana]|uniref:Uncharacterized protein n=1 Tax=Mycteria americana TaxID=33587 RepID=A0AAN7PDL4_MYCAM|nr:hypothetical protein QYF61_008973 [Mycteria americana]
MREVKRSYTVLLMLAGVLSSVKATEGDLPQQVSNPPAMSRDIFNEIRLLRAPSNLTLNVSRDGASTTSLGSLCQWVLKGCSKVSLEPSLLQAEQAQLSQPFLIREVLQPSDHFCGPALDPLQQVCVFPVLRTPELDAALQDTVGFLGCECTLLAHVQLFIHQYPQVLLHRAALNPFISQPVLIPGVALTQVQDPALGLVEPHEVPIGPLLQLVQVPLDGIPSLRGVNHTTQLGVICKLAEGALNPTVHVIDEGVKQYWSQYGSLRDTTCHPSPSGHGAVDHYCLDATIQPIPPPPNRPPIKSVSLQFREKDVVGDCVKGLTEIQIDDIHSSSLVH